MIAAVEARSRPTPKRIAKSGSAQLAERFAGWLSKFSVDKGVRMLDLFPQVDHQHVIDLALARRVTVAGVRADGVEPLGKLFGLLGKEDMATLVGVTPVTLWRWTRDKKTLPEINTEQIIRAMELQMMAADVFGTAEAAQLWLSKPHPSLDAEAPMSYASNEFGAQKIRGMLAALRYGGVA